tara:strand:+ start:94 stop:531 length:438 start_codon:yes stop_codon:yes gene_type:complete
MKNARLTKDLGFGSAEIVAAFTTTPILVPQGHTIVVLTIANSAALDLAATEEVDITLQTTYDDGDNWEALCNVHWDNGEDGTTPTIQVAINGSTFTSTAAITPTGTIADDNVSTTRPIGSELRATVAFTNGGGATLKGTVMTSVS